MTEYRESMKAAGFSQIKFEDVTRQVERTWDLCSQIAKRPEVRLILKSADRKTRQFVESFEAIRTAYATGVMRYGMFAATRGS